MIVGLGTAIVETVRIGRMIERHGEAFLQRVYTPDEIRLCQRRKEYLQAFTETWAAKEAVMKALGTGITRGVGIRDVEIGLLANGQPFVMLHGTARDLAEQQGVEDVLISIAHTRAYATATAIATQNEI